MTRLICMIGNKIRKEKVQTGKSRVINTAPILIKDRGEQPEASMHLRRENN